VWVSVWISSLSRLDVKQAACAGLALAAKWWAVKL
jgi:hypothetical protein